MRVLNKHSVSLQRNFRISEHSGIMYRAWSANIGISENKLVITCCLPKSAKNVLLFITKGYWASIYLWGVSTLRRSVLGEKQTFARNQEAWKIFWETWSHKVKILGSWIFLNVYQIFVIIFQKKTFIYTGSHYTCPYTSLFTVFSYITSCAIQDFCTNMYICSCILLSSNKTFGLCMVKNLLQTVFW